MKDMTIYCGRNQITCIQHIRQLVYTVMDRHANQHIVSYLTLFTHRMFSDVFNMICHFALVSASFIVLP